jgi:hypothetical protein
MIIGFHFKSILLIFHAAQLSFCGTHIQFMKIRGPAQFSQKGEERGPAAVITMIHGITWLLQDVGLLKKSVNTTRNNKGYNSLGLLTEHSTRLVSYWKGQ